MARAINTAPTEAQEQDAFFAWAAYQEGRYPELTLMYHISNEGKRNPRTAKRQGIKSGVPDICLPVPRGAYHGLYIELKRTQGGRVSETQQRWIYALQGHGYCAAICYGWEDAARTVEQYLKMGG